MPLWLLLVIIGVVMALLGVFVQAAQFLIYVGIAILVIGIIVSLVRRAT